LRHNPSVYWWPDDGAAQQAESHDHHAASAGRDRWGPFAALTGIEVLRSAAFFGLNTFIELYWIRHLDASRGLAGSR
jgi:hypothetical protein